MIQGVPHHSFPNSFKRDLLAGKKLIGKGSTLVNETSTKVLGVVGLDWVVLDGEHSPNNGRTWITQVTALKDRPAAPVVRPACNRAVEIKQLLDVGFYNLRIPFVESAEEARRAVSVAHYPSRGIRGVSVSARGWRNNAAAN